MLARARPAARRALARRRDRGVRHDARPRRAPSRRRPRVRRAVRELGPAVGRVDRAPARPAGRAVVRPSAGRHACSPASRRAGRDLVADNIDAAADRACLVRKAGAVSWCPPGGEHAVRRSHRAADRPDRASTGAPTPTSSTSPRRCRTRSRACTPRSATSPTTSSCTPRPAPTLVRSTGGPTSTPRVGVYGGFELGTGVWVNPVAARARGGDAPRHVRIKVGVTIDASPSEVWRVIEPIERHVDWMDDAESITFTSTMHRGVGTALRLPDPRRTLPHQRPLHGHRVGAGPGDGHRAPAAP